MKSSPLVKLNSTCIDLRIGWFYFQQHRNIAPVLKQLDQLTSEALAAKLRKCGKVLYISKAGEVPPKQEAYKLFVHKAGLGFELRLRHKGNLGVVVSSLFQRKGILVQGPGMLKVGTALVGYGSEVYQGTLRFVQCGQNRP